MAGGARAAALIAALMVIALFPGGSLAEGQDGEWEFTTTGGGLPDMGMYSFLRTADLDGDGITDIAASSYDGEGLRVWTGDGRGNFTEASDGLPGEKGYGQMALGDLDGDGRKDLIASGTHWADNKGIRVFLNKDSGGGLSWEEAPSPETDDPQNGVDLLGGVLFAGGVKGARAWRYDDGSWRSISQGLPSGEEMTGVYLAKKGDVMFAVAGSYALKGIRVWELINDRWVDATPPQVKSDTSGSQSEYPIMTDIDGDGELDLAASFGGSGGTEFGLRAWTGRSGLTSDDDMSSASSGLPTGDWYFQFSAIELDGGDGKEIVAGSGKEGDGLHVWSYDGIGWYERETDLPDDGSYYAVTTGDMDGDGIMDIISAPLREGIQVHLNPAPVEGDPGGARASGPMMVVIVFMAAVGVGGGVFIAYRIRK